MEKAFYTYHSIVRRYLPSFVGLLFSFAAIVIVFAMLLNVKNFLVYYENVAAGFIPEVKVRFHNAIPKADMHELARDIERFHGVDSTQYGYARDLKNASFTFTSNQETRSVQTLEKDITLIGFDYAKSREVQLYHEDRSFTVEIKGIAYFGQWFVDIEKPAGIEKLEQCYVKVNGQRLYFEAIDFGQHYKLTPRQLDDPEQFKRLYVFFNEFASRFMDLTNTSIGAARFEAAHYSEREIYESEVFLKRNLQACFHLIFPYRQNQANVLVSSPVFASISKYEQVLQVDLSADGEDKTIRVADYFYMSAEKDYNNNIVLMNYDDISKLYDISGTANLLYVYGKSIPKDAIMRRISAIETNLEHVWRHDAIPSLITQMKTVDYAIYALLALFFVVACCIVMVRLIKFYMVFTYELVFLKIYGFKGSLFTWLLVAAFVSGTGVAFLSMSHLAFLFNTILSKYYYPEIALQMNLFLIPVLICAGIIAATFFVEKILFGKLEYEKRGDYT